MIKATKQNVLNARLSMIMVDVCRDVMSNLMTDVLKDEPNINIGPLITSTLTLALEDKCKGIK